LAKESFQYPETKPLFETLEEISQRSGVSRGKSFEDVIRASVACLAAETMETEYLDAVKDHVEGEQGKRSVDLFGKFFGQTVIAISETDRDVLGDLFQSAVSHQENAFFMTPQPIAELVSKLSLGEDDTDEKKPITISDCCCGTGILLIEAGNQHENAELVGQDVDARCARVSALNLGLRGKYGWVICGNSLSREVRFVYRIGSFFHEGPNGLRRGVIREVSPEQCPVLPELRQQTRQDLFETLEQSDEVKPQNTNSDIVEVPRWLFRLEGQLVSSPTNKDTKAVQPGTVINKAVTPQEKEISKPDTPPSKPSQKNLF